MCNLLLYILNANMVAFSLILKYCGGVNHAMEMCIEICIYDNNNNRTESYLLISAFMQCVLHLVLRHINCLSL